MNISEIKGNEMNEYSTAVTSVSVRYISTVEHDLLLRGYFGFVSSPNFWDPMTGILSTYIDGSVNQPTVRQNPIPATQCGKTQPQGR